MKGEIFFDAVMNRMKTVINVASDSELGARLGMKPNTFSNRKKANSLPYEELIALASSENVNTNWLFYGEGPMYRHQIAEAVPAYNLDQRHANLLTLFDAVTDEQQREILAAAQEKERLNRLEEQLGALAKKLG
ncbi:helix-turn-helix domain-containing protein [Methylomonas sp. MV1]|uniref:helix-turn-helix domain-containing protein n=1 Tax=Methylomonas sp. MV1 TaxID=3073620 RepID=UPI0028A5152B|nr:helix-turn-helix domain-containing protein [Methylomonas sp. MV1]MDT4329787.1 helix-turn-helix domain-containing protein [Methylomonas sp. MV1]